MTNFIHIWKNAIPDEVCDEVINTFEQTIKEHPEVGERGRSQTSAGNMVRDDLSIALDIHYSHNPKNSLCNSIYGQLWKCCEEYKNEYGQLPRTNYDCSNLKVQRTMPYGGFHAWHYEQAGIGNMNMIRELVWTIYLNTMPPHEAETEFLYQAVKVRPQKGSICIFPAAMTHVHRGLTVYTQPKYIITGWFTRKNIEEKIVDKRQLSFDF